MRYRIWCCVSGGVTGHREGWLKNDDVDESHIWETSDLEVARREAERLNKSMNSGYGTARFIYTVKQRKPKTPNGDASWVS